LKNFDVSIGMLQTELQKKTPQGVHVYVKDKDANIHWLAKFDVFGLF
jgi:hypothetical protein